MPLNIEKPVDSAFICTIVSDAGMGKTTLAATFPSPVFIRAEDGMQSIPYEQRPDAFPLISKVEDLWEQFSQLIKEDHDKQTVVIDSVTALDRLFVRYIVDNDPKQPKSINQALGGYGAGLQAVATMHQRVRNACGMLQKKGINVVFLAHAETETIELPDSDPYTRYNVRMNKRSQAPYIDDSDLVGFIKLQTFYRGEDGERKKATSTGARQLVTYATANNISKNRYGIEQDLMLEKGKNPLVGIVPALTK